MSVRYFIIFFLLSLIVSGCSQKNIPSSIQEVSPQGCTPKIKLVKNKENNAVIFAEQQVLNIPAGYKIKEHSTSDDSSSFVYSGNMDMDHATKFYKNTLELDGWLFNDFSTKKEGLFFATKGTKNSCIVSIRPKKQNSSLIHIFIKDENSKQATVSQNPFCINQINRGN